MTMKEAQEHNMELTTEICELLALVRAQAKEIEELKAKAAEVMGMVEWREEKWAKEIEDLRKKMTH